jgi:hypothetical protein
MHTQDVKASSGVELRAKTIPTAVMTAKTRLSVVTSTPLLNLQALALTVSWLQLDPTSSSLNPPSAGQSGRRRGPEPAMKRGGGVPCVHNVRHSPNCGLTSPDWLLGVWRLERGGAQHHCSKLVLTVLTALAILRSRPLPPLALPAAR